MMVYASPADVTRVVLESLLLVYCSFWHLKALLHHSQHQRAGTQKKKLTSVE